MGARWQSSQRPLFVRTVWVDGRRHAILSRDDPLVRLPRPSSSIGASDSSSDSSDSCLGCPLEDCLIKLRLALHPDSYRGSLKDAIYPIRQGTVEASQCYDHEDSDSLFDNDHDYELPQRRLPLLGQYPKVYSFDRADQVSFLPELQLNPLSERVLQWLDLSGKGKRLHTAIHREIEINREEKKSQMLDNRKQHLSRRRELPQRRLSVDILSDTKLSARSVHDSRTRKKSPLTTVMPPLLKPGCQTETDADKAPAEELPVVQNFEPPRLLRHGPTWPSPQSTPNRPQLHIFMPPLDDNRPGDNSESESNHGDAEGS
ncbi:uncharacterized protein LOC129002197 [Macrosteles quadrilineatus]|uniref:uncharacterized protein LOC129002197 n=1 Tax=Macrosteles quadrilineatus TaxID=74068 RepID=UPI0023E1C382|nr:uncharacterized protein LOC129002197 [Macrosteles quadrilineatus]XP_054285810.1 uncharacterized protein LOC129002197 [Macrosteles quadrilineatus]